ncbi:hypothetical protein GCM10011289_12730 [Paludibacterium paludis]|uniref:PAS domain S-box-containing protein/diguanylate cyclase (GGDEF)-like protein n=1 Tax=Paludibacterium paludis TaxID=1225769 RepID=A0A918P0X4_9NEIS|nr:hypothetical protein GCM10011289_12730 [Paludibacterium paludis]
MIVDDEATNIKVLHEAVAELGEVIFASNGVSALERARALRPDVVLLDIEMPGMDGYRVCRELKVDPVTAECAVIFVTADNNPLHELQSLNLGGADFLQKPINIPVARARVKTQLALKRQASWLAQARRDLDEVVHNLPAFIAYWDTGLHNRFCNDLSGAWFGVMARGMFGMTLPDLVGEDVHAAMLPALRRVLEGENAAFELDLTQGERGLRYAQASMVCNSENGKTTGFLLLLTDITARKLAELQLFEEKERIRITLNSIGDAVVSTDEQGAVTFLNPIAEAMTGWRGRDAVGRPVETVMRLTDSETKALTRNPARLALEEKRIVGMGVNFTLFTRDGRECSVESSAAPIMDHKGQVTGAIVVFHDVSEARAMAIKMTHLAHHDALTDLPNRMLLMDRMDQSLRQASHNGTRIALMILDIDQFQLINDAIGYATGDAVLQQISSRIQTLLRTTDTLCRQGGDEFILLLPGLDSVEMAGEMAESLMAICATPFPVGEHALTLSFCIGISVYPDDASDRESLLRHADSAMFRAKQNGRGHYQFFSSDIEELLLARHLIERHLREALEQKLLDVFYQPKVDVATNAIVGVEALLRLRRPSGELVSPAQFIPLAEESGLIVPIGRFVLHKACEQARAWHDAGFDVKVSVNISAIQFAGRDFPALVQSVLAETGMKASRLELEITEGVLMTDVDTARSTLSSLKALGVQIAIDDFGTGYSSLAYLKRFPLDVLKIDQSFVRDMLTDSNDAAIISAIITLGDSLGMQLVAEGVEEVAQAEALRRLGCPVMQGYLYSRPLPAEQMTELLARGF